MYQVLARKYRPRNFIELVGQNHVSRALTSALERGRLHHAYLFTGTRGVGKTTIARILAKCLNCETGVTSTPCEVCATCTAVNEGRFIDLIEIDAASRTKVEDTRELLDNVPYAPTQGRFKVYLIDEVHMLSTHSFNALLKTLEEPPEHVKFLFATTDPQKLPITVISRCLQFTLRPLAVDEITTHLTDILKQEDISAEQDAIWQIAESAQGSLRDALSLTDQAIAYGQGAIQHQDVKEMLGLIDRTIIFDLILAIHQNQQQHVSALLMQFRQQALDVSLVLDQFISTLHELALLQYLPQLSLKYSAEINQKIIHLSGVISAQDLQLYYQVACKGRADLQLAVTQEQGFEMCVLRLLAFRPIQINQVVVSQPLTAQSAPQAQIPQTLIQADTAISTPQSIVATPEHISIQVESTDSNSTFDDAFDLDGADEEFAVASQHNQVHEPSSDDYLEDEIEPNVEAQTAIDETIVSVQLQDTEQKQQTEVANSNEIDNADDLGLSHFGEAPIVDIQIQSTAQVEDIFFLDPNLEIKALEDSANDVILSSEAVESGLKEDHSKTEIHIESLDISANASLTSEDRQPTVELKSLQVMPQDILKLSPQVLEGEWTVDKWEYWFRNSELSPAVQELAQQGVMTGSIDGNSVFLIPQKYESLLTQFQMTLESELKNQWSQTRFSVQYQDVAGATPYDQQVLRKDRAYQQAANLLHGETVVKGLIDTFEAQLHNIQLKP